MSAEDLENYETDMELQLYREYKDIVAQFSYVVETERRFYLTNDVDLQPRTLDGEVYFELTMRDAWVWDMYRPGPVRQDRAGADFQGRQHRGTGEARPRAARQGRLRHLSRRTRVKSVCPQPVWLSTVLPDASRAQSRPAKLGSMHPKDVIGRYGEQLAAHHLHRRRADPSCS